MDTGVLFRKSGYYREYSGDFARPAFYQDLVFDLSDSKIVGFRSARIEIIEATNTEVTYRVLEHLGS